MKPQTFMNLSGESVGEAMRFYKLGPGDIVAVHDELDLLPGKVRIKTGGGHGGHNGLKSLDAHCGNDYRRLRLGIGHPGDKDRVHGHVLGDFAKIDRIWLEPLLDAIADNADLLVKGDDGKLMNKLALPPAARRRPHRPPRSTRPTSLPSRPASRISARPATTSSRRSFLKRGRWRKCSSACSEEGSKTSARGSAVLAALRHRPAALAAGPSSSPRFGA